MLIAGFVDRSHAHLEQALCQYFQSRSLIEPPSNFMRMIAAIGARAEQSTAADSWHMVKSSGSKGMRARSEATEMAEWLLVLCDDEYPVRRALSAIGPRQATMLEVGCLLPRLGLESFGPRAELAPLTRAARGAWIDSDSSRCFEEWLVRLNDRVRTTNSSTPAADRVLANEIIHEAIAMWHSAISDYSQAMSRWRDLERGREYVKREAARERVRFVEASLVREVA